MRITGRAITGGGLLLILVALVCYISFSKTADSRKQSVRAVPLEPGKAQQIREANRIHPLPGTEAVVVVTGKDLTLKANAIGSFPVVTVPAEATIPVRLRLSPNISVQQVALDGGQFDGAKAQQADDQGVLNFDYQIRKEPGNYRVAVDFQGQRLMFNFWVGPALTPRVSP